MDTFLPFLVVVFIIPVNKLPSEAIAFPFSNLTLLRTFPLLSINSFETFFTSFATPLRTSFPVC